MNYRRKPKVIEITAEELDQKISDLSEELEQIRNARDIYAVADDLASYIFLRDGVTVDAHQLIYEGEV